MKWRQIFRKFHGRARREAEMADEMRAHLEMQEERLRAAGMSPEEARYAALRQFGNVASVQERAREARAGRAGVWLEQLGQDLRYAVRQLRSSPGFAAAVTLILGLSIGVSTVVFGLVDALLLKPLPVRDAANVWSVCFVGRENMPSPSILSRPFLRAYETEATVMEDVFGTAQISTNLPTTGARQKYLYGQLVTAKFFPSLGMRPALGRGLTEADDTAGSPPVAVIGYSYWQSHYGGTPEVLGRTLRAGNCTLTIVGVAPAGFTGLNTLYGDSAYWAPAALELQIGAHTAYQLAGRLRKGTSIGQAQEELDAITQRLAEVYKDRQPEGYERYGRAFGPETRVQLVRTALGSWSLEWGGRGKGVQLAWLFGAAAALVWLVSCANVANLLLVRALRRQAEVAVRMALGASRGRLARQLLLEGALLASLGLLAGVTLALLAQVGVGEFKSEALRFIPVDRVPLDGRVLGFAAGLAALTACLFALVPLWQTWRVELTPGLRVDAASAVALRRGRFTLRNLLIVGQVAACFALLVGAGLAWRSFARLVATELGFDPQNLAVATIALDYGTYPDAKAREYMERAAALAAALPGVSAGALGDTTVPFSGFYGYSGTDDIDGYNRRADEHVMYAMSAVGPGFFRMLGVPVLRGREFDAHDRGTTQVAVVNESFVRRYWPTAEPLGKHIAGMTVVGVVRDMRWLSPGKEPEPQVFQALLQGVNVRMAEAWTFTLWLRTKTDVDLVAGALQRELAAIDPVRAELTRVQSMARLIETANAASRGLLLAFATMAAGALVMAVIGLYGVLAYAVGQRAREFGVRLALGATPRQIEWLTLRQGLGLVAVGLASGAWLAWLLARNLEAWLYGVAGREPFAYAGAGLALGAVAVIACWLPARRAARVDPAVTLRSE